MNRASLPQIFIIIPAHNRKEFTSDCLLSLREQQLQNVKSIVIDDGSTDRTSEMIQKDFPEVVLLHGNGDLWWTGATNMGIEYALAQSCKDDYILTLNDDTTVRSDYLQTLLTSAQNHPDSLIGSISISDQDESTVVDAGVRINWLTAKYTNLGKGKRHSDLLHEGTLIHKVDVLPGRGTLIPVEVFKRIGLYDFKRFPHYGADYEFSRRANMRGYELLIHYGAVVISRVKMTGLNNRVNKLGWGDLIRSFFSIRSANNLMNRWRFASLCCSGWRSPFFYACDVGRMIAGSLLYQLGFRKR